MSIAYLDTSALVKQYVMETGSEWVRMLLRSSRTPTVFTSHLTVVETVCAFARRRREGMLSSQDHRQLLAVFDYDFRYRYNILDVEPTVMDTARRMANHHPLRAYDAVQLATAWLLNQDLLRTGKPPITFVCADSRLITIAQAEGLLTDNPNHH